MEYGGKDIEQQKRHRATKKASVQKLAINSFED